MFGPWFIQRDMDVMALGFQKFVPFANGEIILEHGTLEKIFRMEFAEAETNSKWNTIIQNTMW